MSLLETWRNLAYGDGLNNNDQKRLWDGYFAVEKGIYEKILAEPSQVVRGTVKELAEKYDTEVMTMVGFLDGINESLKGYENPIDTMEEDTEVKIEIDPEKLYYNMVAAKANWLYELPQWDAILTEERRKELYKEQKASGTIRKGKKIFPNDPCPCGSGKKYKKCCGKNA
ncbi:MAG: SEC-C domain-containing protein [Clostridiales bacterium]|nr:SEC-C domain-containing protein [Clostridiales bacterium]